MHEVGLNTILWHILHNLRGIWAERLVSYTSEIWAISQLRYATWSWIPTLFPLSTSIISAFFSLYFSKYYPQTEKNAWKSFDYVTRCTHNQNFTHDFLPNVVVLNHCVIKRGALLRTVFNLYSIWHRLPDVHAHSHLVSWWKNTW